GDRSGDAAPRGAGCRARRCGRTRRARGGRRRARARVRELVVPQSIRDLAPARARARRATSVQGAFPSEYAPLVATAQPRRVRRVREQSRRGPDGGRVTVRRIELEGTIALDDVSHVRRFVETLHRRVAMTDDDASRLAMVTHELLENAIKFSADGGASLR